MRPRLRPLTVTLAPLGVELTISVPVAGGAGFNRACASGCGLNEGGQYEYLNSAEANSVWQILVQLAGEAPQS